MSAVAGYAASPLVERIVVPAFVGVEQSGSFTQNYTFTAAPLGAAPPAGTTKGVLFAVGNGGYNGIVPSSVELDGDPASLLTAADTNDWNCSMWFIPTNKTSGEITVSYQSWCSAISIGKFYVLDADPTPVAAVPGSGSSSVALSGLLPANGAGLAVSQSTGGSNPSWTGIAKQYGVDINSNEWSSGAMIAGGESDETLNVVSDGGGGNPRGVLVTFAPRG
ncbi:hypothetical protein HW532_15750 [Kaustia mangrovi]|uniref:Uncharacterized protein n=1 Tax=Kaustia mangrovi TaxID=2593653 RepID=A0A7S8C641_9HYPH|nr:hypothetical protein [Kaustia mangrovi]QPC44016.1 hypothetical protein HW532_15750 [Kaustia mangrovi]